MCTSFLCAACGVLPVVEIRAQIRASRQNPRQCTVPEKMMVKPTARRRRLLGVLAAAGLFGAQGLHSPAAARIY